MKIKHLKILYITLIVILTINLSFIFDLSLYNLFCSWISSFNQTFVYLFDLTFYINLTIFILVLYIRFRYLEEYQDEINSRGDKK